MRSALVSHCRTLTMSASDDPARVSAVSTLRQAWRASALKSSGRWPSGVSPGVPER